MSRIDDAAGQRFFRGHYAVRCPRLFKLGPEKRLTFSLDADGGLRLPTELSASLESSRIAVEVAFEATHSGEGRRELGPICKITFSWTNDGSPETYAFGLFKQGGASRAYVDGMALV
ncbi:MAG: hypothetical protein AAFY88_15265, partial [Acidobacteriota bacterium]